MSHVLVTGGAGYIGSTLVPLLLDRGHEVTVVDRLFFGRDTLPAHPKLTVVREDVRRADPRVFEGKTAVVDLAGISNDPACELDANLTLSVNLEGGKRTHRLAHAAGVERIVFASSCSVYGHAEGTALTETSPLRPVSLYARCKADCEAALLELGRTTGITATSLRFATVFGLSRRMRLDLAVNVMTKNAYVDRRVVVEGGGKQWRPFVHVRDVSEAIARTIEAQKDQVNGQVVNVGSNQGNSRILNLAYRVRDAVPGTEVDVARMDPDLRDYNVSFDKIQAVLGWTPARTIDEGIGEVLEALRSGELDPGERRWYTLRQYGFLVEVERAFHEMELAGHVLS